MNQNRSLVHATARRSRRGMTLVEVTAVLGIQSVLLALLVLLIGKLLHAEHHGRQYLQTGLALDALAAQFRDDVHAASTFELDGGEGRPLAAFELLLADQSKVRYEVKSGGLDRQLFGDGQTQSRETFRLPFESEVSLTHESLGSGGVLQLQILCQPAEAFENRQRWRCEAVLGWDQTLGRNETTGGVRP